MHVFLDTERLIPRQFTVADVDDLVELDGDPGVMRFITGGRSTPRDLIERETLPRCSPLLRAFRGVRLLGGH